MGMVKANVFDGYHPESIGTDGAPMRTVMVHIGGTTTESGLFMNSERHALIEVAQDEGVTYAEWVDDLKAATSPTWVNNLPTESGDGAIPTPLRIRHRYAAD